MPQQLEREDQNDPFVWLEEVEGEEALAWVKERNRVVLQKAEADPAFHDLFERLKTIYNDTNRIAYPSFQGEHVYNFWQDEERTRGLLRRTTFNDYLGGDPDWESVIDVDQLAAEEEENWTYARGTHLKPACRYSLIELSRGGSDAVVVREFDRETREYVEDGFTLPEAKTQVAWLDRDRVLFATDFGEGSLTNSGYPRRAKLWTRGRSIDEADTLFEVDPSDVSVRMFSHHYGGVSYVLVIGARTFYEADYHLYDGTELRKVSIPEDAHPAFHHDQLLVMLNTDWEVGENLYRSGSMLAIGIEEILTGSRDFSIVYEPDERSSLQNFGSTKDFLYLQTIENVAGRIYLYHQKDDRSWEGRLLPLPDLGSTSILSTDESSNRAFLHFDNYLTPPTLYAYDPDEEDELRVVTQRPATFDPSPYLIEQKHASSADGTPIPYFTVRRKDLAFDGTAPTILWGYGGFRVPQSPGYNAALGATWLERGGVWVVANIRGGGEFGPRWHEAALKKKRWRAYEDYFAVAEDLIEQKITSPKHLGVYGGSNGGLLVGVAFTARPDLFNAVTCAVPLLDMRNYHTMLAGASWMAEYGDPDVPDEWEYIRTYSPYHNLKEEVEYPEVLFTTSTKDDRVHPGHARKMAALMESMGHPTFYFENTEGGHAGGVNHDQHAHRQALVYTYFGWKLMGEEK